MEVSLMILIASAVSTAAGVWAGEKLGARRVIKLLKSASIDGQGYFSKTNLYIAFLDARRKWKV